MYKDSAILSIPMHELQTTFSRSKYTTWGTLIIQKKTKHRKYDNQPSPVPQTISNAMTTVIVKFKKNGPGILFSRRKNNLSV